MDTYEEEMKSDWWPIMGAVALTRDDWPEVCNDAEAKIESLKAELAELRKDKARLDWLGDRENKIGNVTLPDAIVERTLMLRDSIDLAMQIPN